ncbi:hypothetical protein HK101_007191 [Irineochytrium annulatum]|nr:hypothetical protein HK101_007191 [Irineochytrium annulatum]
MNCDQLADAVGLPGGDRFGNSGPQWLGDQPSTSLLNLPSDLLFEVFQHVSPPWLVVLLRRSLSKTVADSSSASPLAFVDTAAFARQNLARCSHDVDPPPLPNYVAAFLLRHGVTLPVLRRIYPDTGWRNHIVGRGMRLTFIGDPNRSPPSLEAALRCYLDLRPCGNGDAGDAADLTVSERDLLLQLAICAGADELVERLLPRSGFGSNGVVGALNTAVHSGRPVALAAVLSRAPRDKELQEASVHALRECIRKRYTACIPLLLEVDKGRWRRIGARAAAEAVWQWGAGSSRRVNRVGDVEFEGVVATMRAAWHAVDGCRIVTT